MKKINIKHLTFGLYQKGGRASGRITAPRRGALVKRIYRFLDTKRRLWSSSGARILNPYIYDPYRTGFISLTMLPNGILTYILAAQYLPTQQRVYNLTKISLPGTSKLIRNLNNGTLIFNCELHPFLGGQMLRSAGVSGVLLRKTYTSPKPRGIIKLKSGALRAIPINCTAVIGISSNPNHFLIEKKKAGTIRLKGFRPNTRPSAKNPVDHPMGGRTKGGTHPKSRKGILIGSPTVNPRKRHQLEKLTCRQYKLKHKK